MKKNYVKPVFIAEEYSFNENFALGCSPEIDMNSPLKIYSKQAATKDNPTTALCAKENAHGSHYYDIDSSIAYQYARMDDDGKGIIVIFNIGDVSECEFKWAGYPDVVYGPNGDQIGSFSQALHSKDGSGSSGSEQHRPGYNGYTFMYS